jgi:hypothetical protein
MTFQHGFEDVLHFCYRAHVLIIIASELLLYTFSLVNIGLEALKGHGHNGGRQLGLMSEVL